MHRDYSVDPLGAESPNCDPRIAAALERASELDRVWFEHHPERGHRVRKLVPGEPLLDDDTPSPVAALPAYVIVKQAVPGIRLKAAFHGTRRPCDCEDCAADLWRKFSPPKFQTLAVEMAALMLRMSS